MILKFCYVLYIIVFFDMGNICSYNDNEKIELLENRLDDQNSSLEKLHQENKILKRENKYFKERLEKIMNQKINSIL